jgi:hypothetical protein
MFVQKVIWSLGTWKGTLAMGFRVAKRSGLQAELITFPWSELDLQQKMLLGNVSILWAKHGYFGVK